ncbi:trehalose-phosphatase [Halochromatium salexigens]|uniref:Trehalose 6-phosphate phosphatase n=2 Tax=Halochromatium salexigens TaxID=49447 RepID=A0AAJ0XFM6_HALSE|nr:trehalose-phosphatase [Halochromatium salexigens]
MTDGQPAMTNARPVFSRDRLDAVLFDLDGVLTRTAEIHAEAWKRLFDDYLSERPATAGEDHSRFDDDHDYRRYVDGRPRLKGVKHFLLARGIDLPEGEPDDPPEHETLHGLGNRKNALFRELIEQRGIHVYACAVDLLRRLRRAGFRTAVVTASKNCELILQQAGLNGLFDEHLDGVEAEALELAGKPDPDTFVEAAQQLGCEPKRAAVLEDATAGVMAASRGHFGLVIGIDRDGQRESLLSKGADLVFDDLCQIGIESTHREMPPLLEEMALISDRLADKQPALFLDYDGTLTPIVERPADAQLSHSMRRALRDAAEQMPLAVISGRDLDDISALVGLDNLIYAGSHGFDIRGPDPRPDLRPDLRMELPEGIDALDALQQAAATLEARLADVAGVRVERKRFAVAIHVRQVADRDLPRVREAVDQTQRSLDGLRQTGGKRLFELRPDVDWDKGQALRWLLSELGLEGPDVLPLYLGDDDTDEDAFRVLRQLGGISILVAEAARPSAADYRLRAPDDVEALLIYLTGLERDA